MVSGKLIHLIESHWDELTNSVIDEIRREPAMTHIQALSRRELRDWGQEVLENLGHWLTARNDTDLARRYEHLGKRRFEEDVPLAESVQGLSIIREKVLDFVAEQVCSKTTLDLYAEEELDRRLGRFFDLLTIHMTRGYEHALRRAFTHAHLMSH